MVDVPFWGTLQREQNYSQRAKQACSSGFFGNRSQLKIDIHSPSMADPHQNSIHIYSVTLSVGFSQTQLFKKLTGPPIYPDFQFRIENCSTLTKSQSTNSSSMQEVEVGGKMIS